MGEYLGEIWLGGVVVGMMLACMSLVKVQKPILLGADPSS